MGQFNPNSPAVLGQEWRPTYLRQYVLDSPGKGIAMRMKPQALATAALDVFISGVVGSPGIAFEILSDITPLVPNVNEDLPNVNVSVGSWQNQVGAAATFAETSDSSLATYHRNTAAVPVGSPIYHEERENNIWAAVIQKYPRLRVGVQVTTTAPALVRLLINVSGTRYFGPYFVVPTTVFGPVWYFQDWYYNPATNLPWTDTEVNTFNGSAPASSWGLEVQGPYASVVPAQGFRLYETRLFRSSTGLTDGNRLFYSYQQSLSTGVSRWIEQALTAGGAIYSANQWVYAHFFPWIKGDGGNAFSIPILGSGTLPTEAAVNTSVTSEHRKVYETKVDPGGLLLAATPTKGEMIPVLLDRSGTIDTASQPYTVFTIQDISAGVLDNGQTITTAAATSYAGLSVTLGGAHSTLSPDAPLTVELRHGAGMLAGAGTLDATWTINPSEMPGGNMNLGQIDFFLKFPAALALLATTQYFVRFISAATAARAWRLSPLDVGAVFGPGVVFADAAGASQGGTTDTFIRNQTAFTQQDAGLAMVASPVGPASITITAVPAI